MGNALEECDVFQGVFAGVMAVEVGTFHVDDGCAAEQRKMVTHFLFDRVTDVQDDNEA